MASFNPVPTVVLANGVQMPVVGFGTYQITDPNEAYNLVRFAIEAGYRHIDTAALYMNEEPVGKAIRDSGVDRQEIFLVTKMWNTEHGYDKALKAFDASIARLGLDYVDLYLIHWPKP